MCVCEWNTCSIRALGASSNSRAGLINRRTSGLVASSNVNLRLKKLLDEFNFNTHIQFLDLEFNPSNVTKRFELIFLRKRKYQMSPRKENRDKKGAVILSWECA